MQVSEQTPDNIYACSDRLSPGPEQGQMDCMVLCRTFHTTLDQGKGRMGYILIFQDLKNGVF